MEMNQYCRELKKQYPSYVSKEQLRVICHISKRKAQYLLLNGLIPCDNSGKLTRNFKIKIDDVIMFLKDREKNPEKYVFHQGGKAINEYTQMEEYGITVTDLSDYYKEIYDSYPDILVVQDIHKITGASKNSILRWLKNKKMNSLMIKNSYKVPKEYLIEFLTSQYYIKLGIKTEKQIKDLEGFYLWYKKRVGQR